MYYRVLASKRFEAAAIGIQRLYRAKRVQRAFTRARKAGTVIVNAMMKLTRLHNRKAYQTLAFEVLAVAACDIAVLPCCLSQPSLIHHTPHHRHL